MGFGKIGGGRGSFGGIESGISIDDGLGGGIGFGHGFDGGDGQFVAGGHVIGCIGRGDGVDFGGFGIGSGFLGVCECGVGGVHSGLQLGDIGIGRIGVGTGEGGGGLVGGGLRFGHGQIGGIGGGDRLRFGDCGFSGRGIGGGGFLDHIGIDVGRRGGHVQVEIMGVIGGRRDHQAVQLIGR